MNPHFFKNCGDFFISDLTGVKNFTLHTLNVKQTIIFAKHLRCEKRHIER
jgi:hypothetical protein